MLFILTEKIQRGKTRWLEHAARVLEARGVAVAGVVSPGVWREHAGEDGDVQFEKLGIDCVLLPQEERLHMAVRADLSMPDDGFDLFVDNPHMMWNMSSASVAAVNEHFDRLARHASCGTKRRGVLLVDEIGWVELQGRGGFTRAVALLDKGPGSAFPHALIVARDSLHQQVEDRFKDAWGGAVLLSPDQEGLDALIVAVC